MKEVTIIGVDLAKNVFQLHGAAADGSVVFRKRLMRTQFRRFMSDHPSCLVAMEACPSAHYWARELKRSGHQVRLISPQYVKPYAKRQKNDVIDAEAIVEAALRPNMRFVEPKTEAQQARAVVFRIRQKYVHQRIELINALRSHLYEFGYIAPQGPQNLYRLTEVVEDESTELPSVAREACRGLMAEIKVLEERIEALNRQIEDLAKEAETTRRLQTMPGIGPITALAIEAFAPPMESFRRGRDFAAWLGLVPRQSSSGGKRRLGRTSKMGQHDIRRLLIIGAMAAMVGACRRGVPEGTWLGKMMLRKPRILVAIALANKMARRIWAMLTKKENYRDPALAAA